MPTSATWNGTLRSIPNSSELNWQALTGFLVDLANNAQTTNFQKIGMRVALTSPVTVAAATDCVVVTNLTVAGAVAVTLPAGVLGQMFCVVDGKGDAATNNITITPAAGNINGAATYVINGNRNGIIIAYNGTEWTILAEFIASGTAGSIPRSQIAAGTANYVVINGASGELSEEQRLATVRGGTGQDFSASTGVIKVTTGTMSAAAVNLASADVTGTLPIGNGGTGQTTQTNAFDALAPTTTKGDLIAHNGTDNIRVPVGTNGYAVVADSAQASGLNYANVVTNPMTTAGDMIYGGAAGVPTRLVTGTNGQIPVSTGSTVAFTDTVATQKRFSGGIIDVGYVGTNPEVGGASPFQMVNANRRIQVINTAGAATFRLPTTGIVVGEIVRVVNRSTNAVTVEASGGANVVILYTGFAEFICLTTTPTLPADWFVSDLQDSGVFSPTATAGANIATASAAADSMTWNRSRNIVNCGGFVTVDATAANTNSGFTLSLPVSSNFTSNTQLAGTAVGFGLPATPAMIRAETTNDVAEFSFYTTADVSSNTWSYVIVYRVL